MVLTILLSWGLLFYTILLYLNKLKAICFPKEICEYGNYLVILHRFHEAMYYQ